MPILDRFLAALTSATTTAWALCVLVFASDAGITVPALFILVYGAIGALALWACRLAVHLLATRPERDKRRVPMLLLNPAVVVVCFALVWSGAAFLARFTASRPALDAFVRTDSPVVARGAFKPGARVGLFRLHEAELLPNGIVRLITTECMFDDCGVVYSPHGRPPRLGEDTYRHLGGGWYHWHRSW